MSSNYEQAKTLLDGIQARELYKEGKLEKAAALATLALVDEMRAERAPELSEVYVLQQYNPQTYEEMFVMDVFRKRTEAYGERDRLNALAHSAGAPLRYIIKEKTLK